MRHLGSPRSITPRLLCSLATLLLLVAAGRLLFAPAYGAQLVQRSLKLNNNLSSATSIYQASFSIDSNGVLGSIDLQFCANDPFLQDPCQAPVGLDLSAATLTAQTGITGFSISSSSTANNVILTRLPGIIVPTPVSYTLSGVNNPSSSGSYYVRLSTYATADASGNASNYGGIAFAISNSLSVSAEVPPYLLFCTGISIPIYNCASSSGEYVDFGELTSHYAAHGLSQMLAATNGQNGYSITIDGTTLTSGNNVINPLAVADVSRPGTSQFGMNLVANASPSGGSNPSGPGLGAPTINYNQPNFYRFNPADVVVTNNGPDNIREYTTSYLVNVPSSQPPGVYVSTITYICVANF